jgi:hypothetical protein
MYTTELRARLERLGLERREAQAAGLTGCRAYMDDLEGEITLCRAALVGACVTEIAIARAELSGRLAG